MATIRAIEPSSIHQIQSGQVIVDLCSVVKELVENSIDAGASIVDVRFKNQGLESIEVQDNGSGISVDNHESIALKHHTSKLSTYSDLDALKTFGFRGEALSSLCALSRLIITTCCVGDTPRATKLEFEPSGKVESTCIVAGQKGTTVSVNNLFHTLPVRRRELERNIKREWNKVIALLNQYACIQTNLKFTVSQQPTKGKRIVLFSTKGNLTTSENIVNIFGPRTLSFLISLDVSLEFTPTIRPSLHHQSHPRTIVQIQGFVSRPAHGEGRQTPDRQMFFVNGRPCLLPQFAKIFNEVYRTYNAFQSPFIFANILLDTCLYDVNVSPDKRTILIHEQGRMLESLRESLARLFESQDYSMPVSHPPPHSARLSTAEDSTRNPGASMDAGPGAGHQTEQTTWELDNQVPTEEPVAANPFRASFSAMRRTPVRESTQRRRTSREVPAKSLLNRWINTHSESPPSSVEVTGGQMDTNTTSNGSPPDSQDETVTGDILAVITEEASFDHHDPNHDQGSPQQFTPTSKMKHTTDPGTNSHVEKDHFPSGDIQGVSEATLAFPRTPCATPEHSFRSAARTTAGAQSRTPRSGTQSTADNGAVKEREARPLQGAGCDSDTETLESSTQPPPEAGSTSTRDFSSRLRQMFSATTEGRFLGYHAIDVPPEDRARINSELSSICDGSTKHKPDDYLPLAQKTAEAPSSESRLRSPEQIESPEIPRYHSTSPILHLESNATTNDAKVKALGRSTKRQDTTLNCVQTVNTSKSTIRRWCQIDPLQISPGNVHDAQSLILDGEVRAENAEESLSLTIAKADFEKMKVVGQFNLGFILALRQGARSEGVNSSRDQLFIIDQHASDEKYNFERLQATTVVQSQRLVQSRKLELTALEEEIVQENISALELNGFKVRIDRSGDIPVGSRCELMALPLSRETIFTLSDLEELISLLGDDTSGAGPVPRPSRVRKMFAMRACRSSIMIGKALSRRQMEGLVRHMGELDKPWNCPHGRPTMRHLCGLGPWDDETGWRDDAGCSNGHRWATYAQKGSGQAT